MREGHLLGSSGRPTSYNENTTCIGKKAGLVILQRSKVEEEFEVSLVLEAIKVNLDLKEILWNVGQEEVKVKLDRREKEVVFIRKAMHGTRDERGVKGDECIRGPAGIKGPAGANGA